MNDDELGQLPKADRNAQLQRESIRAFNAFLPTDRFLFRNERTDDAGVDGSLELLIAGRYTNLRSQIQLKSTESKELNSDGSISIQITVRNLNYLLNGQSPLYILYDLPRNELRYLWAREERKRLDDKNPNWVSQENINIRFQNLLTSATLEQIHERIRAEAQLHRRILETLARADTNENVIFGVDPDTLNNSDPIELFDVLMASGNSLISSGYAEQVKNLISHLNRSDAQKPRIQLILAYAEFVKGHYQAALANLAEAFIHCEELKTEDQQFLLHIRDACEYQVGRISVNEFINRLSKGLDDSTNSFALSHRLNFTRYSIFIEHSPIRRAELTKEMLEIVEEIIALPEDHESLKLQAQLQLLETKGGQCWFDASEEFSHIGMRKAIGLKTDVYKILERQIERWDQWEQEATLLIKEAIEMGISIFIGDGFSIRGMIRQFRILNEIRFSEELNPLVKVSDTVWQAAMNDAEHAVRAYEQANQLEGQLRSRMLIAGLLSLVGKQDISQKIALEVLPIATAMNYIAIEWLTQQYLSGQSPLQKLRAMNAQKDHEEQDFHLLSNSKEELDKLASDMLRRLDLPIEKLPILQRAVYSCQDIARERVNWCQHINLNENLLHREHQETCYKSDPARVCICEKHKYQSAIENPDWVAIISAFKKAYCTNCLDRNPKISLGKPQ